MAAKLAERVIDRYCREEIDSVYLVYNEFKSVIAQRLVVEQILPVEQIGQAASSSGGRDARKGTRAGGEAAREAGSGCDGPDTREIDAAAAKFATAAVDYIYEQPP